jgi:hypothetical protein
MARLAQVARPERLRGQQSRRDILEGEVVIGLSVEEGIQPLKNGKLLFFQMTDHLRNELFADFPELDATAAAWPMPKDFGRDQPKPLGDWFDRRVLPGEETGQIAFTSGADEREDNILLECIVVQELIEKADQLMQLLSFLVIAWIRRSVASFARNPVLQLAHRYQNAEVLLVQDLSQQRQAGHVVLVLPAASVFLVCSAARYYCDAQR